MKILAVGGGSGGHVTPVVAVFKALRQERSDVQLRFWCDYSFYKQASSIVADFDATIPVQKIVAGKLRRYYHLTLWQQITWPSLVLKNLRDSILVLVGIAQSLMKLILWRPDVVFTKGGFVCLPVGIAAKILQIPLVIHDSDAHPGLTNRILGRWANTIATGAPLEYYHYDKKRSHYTGIPVDQSFHPFTESERVQAKKELKLDSSRPLLVVTGGGLGAQRINNLIVATLSRLEEFTSVVLISGTGQYDELKELLPHNHEQFYLYPFVTNMNQLLGAADVVISRAGATTLLELAALEKPTIIIPNAKLTGGHQLKNAAVYAEKQAVVVLNEEEIENQPQLLVDSVKQIIEHPSQAHEIAKRFHEFSKPDAAKEMAQLILKTQ